MNSQQESISKRIQVANKEKAADLVIKNGQVVDVFNLEILHTDVAIADGMIVGLGQYEGIETLDAKGRFVAPSFIDGHVHIESSMVPPSEFAKVVLPHGVTTVITDPHEISNVSGKHGLQFMMDNASDLPLDIFFMLPSCVPATPFENAGAQLKADDLQPFLTHEQVLGLAEVMDYPSLNKADPALLEKIIQTTDREGKIDGHLAGLGADAVNVYTAAGVKTDHECNTAEEAIDRLRRGMYVIIREGSVAKNLKALIPAVHPHNTRRFLFCTDDKHIDDLLQEGSIDHHLRLAVQEGLSPLTAIQMATLNAAECYGLDKKGAIAPGYEADVLLIEDLETFAISHVFKKGKVMARSGQYLQDTKEITSVPRTVKDTVHIPSLSAQSLTIPINNAKAANIIQIKPNQLRTNHLIETVDLKDGVFYPSIKKDQLKLVVVERHHMTGNIGLGIVKGMGLQEGAIATTIAHDSHNIVAIGTNDHDIVKAIEQLATMQGGLTIVQHGQIRAALSLPIAGLMSDQDYGQVKQGLHDIHKTLHSLGFTGGFNPFLTLSFLTLPVIPSLKLTDKGLFDVEKAEHIDVSV